jgi:hypothetical protein
LLKKIFTNNSSLKNIKDNQTLVNDQKTKLKYLNTELKSVKTMLEKSSLMWKRFNETFISLEMWLKDQETYVNLKKVQLNLKIFCYDYHFFKED